MNAKEALDHALDDVESRFLYNQPVHELQQVDRLFFQIEQAYWYYEDFKADFNSLLPHFSNLKSFAYKIFNHCPLLHKVEEKFYELFDDYRCYKSKIPIYGCILLNNEMNQVVLVCDYQSKTWTFPRGKINENETSYQCAIRETYEETGFNCISYTNEEDNLEAFYDGKKVQLFIGQNIPLDTKFITLTRKEISKISFHYLDNLPKTYGVNPFIPKLKRWIMKQQKKNQKSLIKKSPKVTSFTSAAAAAATTTTTLSGISSSGKKVNQFDMRNVDTFDIKEEDLKGNGRNKKRWSVEEMFNANAKITGRDYNAYDGNPHEFGSAHPRYVDYSKAHLLPSSTNDNNSSSSSSSSTVSTSKDFMLPPSEIQSIGTSEGANMTFFPLNFKLDIKSIMKTMDNILEVN